MADFGYLKIGVFDEKIANPVKGAKINISTIAGDKVGELISDESGQSETLELPAPLEEFSLLGEGGKPYSEYTVSIIHNQKSLVIEGVQIYPNVSAEQTMILTPRNEVLNIPEPVLWGSYPRKIPEEDIKELPPSKGFVVLPEPVIPELVVVHEGMPDNKDALNRYVPFKDYIKKVACCEIYSTWPEAAIRANVMAILSFTLNRVYTEWYRGKGYSFTITNTTAFDQAFNDAQTVYQEISVIVDEIFTTFITKEGIKQPLFTQYCDGRRSSCPNNLSQWGTKELADKGQSALEILKHYYGPEIFLMQAKKVEGIPTSFAGENLQEGSLGESVRVIQSQLNSISNNFPAIQKLAVDGVYNSSTRQAVEKFQEVFNLPQTGIVDFATWYRISDIYVAVTKMS